jgi:hypothetical protein
MALGKYLEILSLGISLTKQDGRGKEDGRAETRYMRAAW